ncbi:MAG: ankyrin repeat domain-containing protein [Spirulina sp. SIO3F2]|nr:ankyrin repeat domain-containing protein [Spirulina sp. SIO3F2]
MGSSLGFPTVVELLRKAGASERGLREIELIHAVKQEHVDSVRELIRLGASFNHWIDGMNALELAVEKNNLDSIEIFIEAGADATLLS